MSSPAPAAAGAPGPAPPRPALLALAYLAFVSLGLPDAALGVAWPSLRADFALPQAALGVALAAAAVAYFASGALAGRLVRGLGVGGVLAASTVLVAAGASGYALAPAFAAYVAAAVVVGLGSGAVDAGLNAYAAHHFGARHMTWLHAAYSAGAAAGPALLTVVLARGLGWRVGYGVIALLLAVLAVAFVRTRRGWNAPAAEVGAPDAPDASVPAASAGAALRRGRVWVQIALFVVYAGIEVTAGQWTYTVLVERRGVAAAAAGALVTLYWGSLLGGRVLLGLVVERVGTVRLLRVATVGAVLGAALVALPAAPVGVAAAGLALLGFAIAPIFPGLMSETPRRVGRDVATHAVGFQVSAATFGVATLPALAGVLGARLGLNAVPAVVLACAVALLVLHEGLVARERRGGSL